MPHTFNAAKNYIPDLWKQTQSPTVAMWLAKVEDVNILKDLILTNLGARNKFLKKWFYRHEFTISAEYKSILEHSEIGSLWEEMGH